MFVNCKYFLSTRIFTYRSESVCLDCYSYSYSSYSSPVVLQQEGDERLRDEGGGRASSEECRIEPLVRSFKVLTVVGKHWQVEAGSHFRL